MKTPWEPRKDPGRRFTQNSLNGMRRSISYIYCERLNLLLRSVNDLTTMSGVRREKSKAGTLSKRLEKPHSHPKQKLIRSTRRRSARIWSKMCRQGYSLVRLPGFRIVAGSAPRELHSVNRPRCLFVFLRSCLCLSLLSAFAPRGFGLAFRYGCCHCLRSFPFT